MAAPRVDRQQFRKDYMADQTPIRELARRYGCSDTWLFQIRKRMGLPPRDAEEQKRAMRVRHDGDGQRARARQACNVLLEKLQKHHPLPARAARDVPVGASWAFTEHRTCAEMV
jgi:transposase-like protein